MLSHPTTLQHHHDHHHRVELSWKLRGCQIVTISISTIAITWSSLTFWLLCLNRAYFVMKADSCRKSFLFSFAAESFQKYLGLEAQTGVDQQWLWDWAATLLQLLFYLSGTKQMSWPLALLGSNDGQCNGGGGGRHSLHFSLSELDMFAGLELQYKSSICTCLAYKHSQEFFESWSPKALKSSMGFTHITFYTVPIDPWSLSTLSLSDVSRCSMLVSVPAFCSYNIQACSVLGSFSYSIPDTFWRVCVFSLQYWHANDSDQLRSFTMQ